MPRPPSTGTSPVAGAARSGRSCSRSRRPRAGTPRTGQTCSVTGWGSFPAAVFGANDGLVSNLALVIGVAAAGTSSSVILLTGLAGLLAGALSMGAGEFISVRSQRELLAASTPSPAAASALPHLDVDTNELVLVYRARGLSADEAKQRARYTSTSSLVSTSR